MSSQGVLCPQRVLYSGVDRAAGAGAPFFVLCPVAHAKHSLAPAEALARHPGGAARVARELGCPEPCKGLCVHGEPES